MARKAVRIFTILKLTDLVLKYKWCVKPFIILIDNQR